MADKNVKKNFILTFDESVANKLTQDGFTLLSNNNGQFMFINNGALKFEDNEDTDKTIKNMCYTNVLCMTK